ncbi:MAG: hypothetical protein A2V81_01775 [Candidatus Abawacabacteria bacterium RBG_16_42_10]|uniref:LTD domain-containing protein n=1 Tax=Candidatus Abawacabacteria bacterium RBG_16_42_10 TaxID=1817814 RepID=A0A1F4XJD2_9BACT|nr:MAG: hypothetical protein A2V81_01775 [Candidatus Abawacabacteria bacterium RBG_16_42_10]
MKRYLIYVSWIVSFIILYSLSAHDSLSATTDPESEICNNPSSSQIPSPSNVNPGDFIISQVMPNPKGKDQGTEWIEFKNNTSQDLNLLNFVLVINDKNYDLPETIIAAKQKFHVLSKDLKITLPNKASILILQDVFGKEIDRLQYPEAKDDVIFSHDQKITQLKLPSSGNDGGLLASAGATFLIRLWLKDRIS